MKRFTETLKWSDPWFRKLAPRHKLLWQWVSDCCDGAGVADPDWEIVSLQIGEYVDDSDVAAFGGRLIVLPNGKVWMRDFIEFQYGKLSRDCKPHAPVFASIEKNQIPVHNDTLPKGYPKGLETLQEKERDKEEVKDQETDKPAREAKSRPSKLAQAEADAREASQQSIPLELNCDGFPAAWGEWCDYRTELQRRKPEKAWTARTARSCLKECAEHGAKSAVQAITNSISNSWQGLIWDRVGTARGSPPSKQSMRNDHPQQEYIPLPEL